MEELIAYFEQLDPVTAALLATIFTWLLTAAGASLFFLFKKMNRKLFDGMLGFTGGVMVAASFWSLLAPGIEMSPGEGFEKTVPPLVGFGLGALFLFGLDKILPHLHVNFKMNETEGIKTPWHKSVLLTLAITLHNIPEGFAVAMPLRGQGMSRWKSFNFGQLSAIVEPFAAVLGAWAVMTFEPILPYALSFAAGAMIFVVVEEVVPESQKGNFTDIATMGFILGFMVMMTLDVGLG